MEWISCQLKIPVLRRNTYQEITLPIIRSSKLPYFLISGPYIYFRLYFNVDGLLLYLTSRKHYICRVPKNEQRPYGRSTMDFILLMTILKNNNGFVRGMDMRIIVTVICGEHSTGANSNRIGTI